eukprot:jgi/Ulvmu1/9996/UM059_0045.1
MRKSGSLGPVAGSGALSSTAIQLALASFCCWLSCDAFPTYPRALPSGAEVTCPGHFSAAQAKEQCSDGVCHAVGHVDCRGGSIKGSTGTSLNSFGQAFRDAGYQWTAHFCRADSDGDGRTNGQELGDPCCVWHAGKPLPVDPSYVISHPGDPEDTTPSPAPSASDCRALQAARGGAAGSTSAEAVEAMFAPGEERREIHFQVKNHKLMANETVYANAFFPVPQEEALYIVGFVPNIDNKHMIHHLVAYFCTGKMPAYTSQKSGQVINPDSAEMNGYVPESCQRVFYAWAPGADHLLMPDAVHIHYGKGSGFKTVLLEIHYNNLDGLTDVTDASGVTAYATTKPRSDGAMWLWLGAVEKVGTIPPNSTHFSASECKIQLRPGCEEIHVFASIPHAHYTGIAVWSELYEQGSDGELSYVQDVVREMRFSYLNQYTRTLLEPVRVVDGQVISTACIYNTAGRAEDTVGGVASHDEMCLDALLTYPDTCLYGVQCSGIPVDGEVPEDVNIHEDTARTGDLYKMGTYPNYAAIATGFRLKCNLSQAMQSRDSLQTDQAVADLWSTAHDHCPGIAAAGRLILPEAAHSYECPQDCVAFLLNLGICSETAISQEWDAIMLLGHGTTPLTAAPSTCNRAIKQKAQQMAAGAAVDTALIAELQPTLLSNARQAWGPFAAFAAVALVILVIVNTTHIRGMNYLHRQPGPSIGSTLSTAKVDGVTKGLVVDQVCCHVPMGHA